MSMEKLAALVPEQVKEAVTSHQNHRLLMARTGLDEVTLQKLGAYIGGRVAARRARWRPVFDGFRALKNLRRS